MKRRILWLVAMCGLLSGGFLVVRAEDAKISPPPPRGVHVRGEFCSCKCECCAKCEKCAKMKRPERPRPPQRNEAKKAIDKAL